MTCQKHVGGEPTGGASQGGREAARAERAHPGIAEVRVQRKRSCQAGEPRAAAAERVGEQMDQQVGSQGRGGVGARRTRAPRNRLQRNAAVHRANLVRLRPDRPTSRAEPTGQSAC